MTENGKMEVLYLGSIWISSTFINSSTFGGYKSDHPHEKIIISQNGSSRSVFLKDIDVVSEKELKKMALQV